jgi:UDP-glucose 6-dehydrogenase
MPVTIFGSGYVGLVTGASLADAGNHVICVDVDAAKSERLNRGEVPIHELDLEPLIRHDAEADGIELCVGADMEKVRSGSARVRVGPVTLSAKLDDARATQAL